MKLIKPSFEIINQEPELIGIYKIIELAGRTCYKSQRPEGQTAKDFVDRIIASKHYAMLEHGTVYLKVVEDLTTESLIDRYRRNKYSVVSRGKDKCSFHGDTAYLGNICITTNYRVLVENRWLDDLQYLCKPTKFHEKRVTVRFITDIGVSRELNRHRADSIAEQSTRYCNYSKDKFNNEISVVLPDELSDPELKPWLEDCDEFKLKELSKELLDNNIMWGVLQNWLFANLACEYAYMNLIRLGWKPQQARRVLPLDTKSELVHTAFVSDWKHLCRLRSSFAETGQPHPDMKALVDPLLEEFIVRGYMEPLV